MGGLHWRTLRSLLHRSVFVVLVPQKENYSDMDVTITGEGKRERAKDFLSSEWNPIRPFCFCFCFCFFCRYIHRTCNNSFKGLESAIFTVCCHTHTHFFAFVIFCSFAAVSE